jgi:transposase
MPHHKSQDYKISAVKYYLKSKHQTETCEIFECSQRSLMRWVDKYNKNKTVKRKTKKAMSYKVTQQHIKYIIKQLKSNKTISMHELSNSINDTFGWISDKQYKILKY